MRLSLAHGLACFFCFSFAVDAQEPKPVPPWKALGKVTDPAGRPLVGVQVWASTGRGTLRRTGTATSGEDGHYELSFGPGIFFEKKEATGLLAAIIGAHLPGFFEENLNRQGAYTAADGEPTGEQLQLWKTGRDRIFLPGQPKELNFIMRPAGRVAGKLIDEAGNPLTGYSVSLTGPDLAPASSVWVSAIADAQGRFVLEDIPTTYRFQFTVRKADPQPPWDDSWASAGLRFEKPDGDLQAWFGDREIRLGEFILRVAGPGMHDRNAIPIAGIAGKLDLTGDASEQAETLLAAKSAVLTLRNSSKREADQSLILDSVPLAPAKISPTRMTRTRPNADGEFTVSFANPDGFTLVPGKHQVIFEVKAGKPPRERIFRQIEIQVGRYEEPVKLDPSSIDDAIVSVTFVTIQPKHNEWVKAFFLDGKGTNYSGIWTSDGGLVLAIVFAK